MIDARGYSCPMPVVMVQKEVKANAPQTLEVLVDDPCAVSYTHLDVYKRQVITCAPPLTKISSEEVSASTRRFLTASTSA